VPKSAISGMEFSVEHIDRDAVSGATWEQTTSDAVTGIALIAEMRRKRTKNRCATTSSSARGIPAPIIFLSSSASWGTG